MRTTLASFLFASFLSAIHFGFSKWGVSIELDRPVRFYSTFILAYVWGGSFAWTWNKRALLKRLKTYQLRVRDTAGSTLTVDHFFQRITKGI